MNIFYVYREHIMGVEINEKECDEHFFLQEELGLECAFSFDFFRIGENGENENYVKYIV